MEDTKLKSEQNDKAFLNNLESEVRDLRSKIENSDSAHLVKVFKDLKNFFLKFIFVFLGFVASLDIYNSYSIMKFQKQIRDEFYKIIEIEFPIMKKALLMEEIAAHIDRALRRIKFGNLQDRDNAIWEDLHEPLKAHRRCCRRRE